MADFLEGLDSRPVVVEGAGDLEPCGLFLGRQSGWQVEVLHLRAKARPTATGLREVWRKRSGGRPAPVLVVVTQADSAHLCGPSGDEPPVLQDVPLSHAESLCRVALGEPSKETALRFLRTSLPEVASRTPGLRNEGLMATHELEVGVPARRDWPRAAERSTSIATLRGPTLVQALGFTIESAAQPYARLLVGNRKTAVAIFLDRSESPEIASERFTGRSPVSYALAKADDEGLPFVLVTCGPSVRLYPVKQGVGVGRRGRPETFVELHLELLAPSKLAYLWLLFSAEALGDGGTFEKILADSRRYAADLGQELRRRIYEGVVWRLATAIARARKLRKPTTASLSETYRATLTLLFRLLFIAYAEDRDLLPYKTNGRYRDRSLKHLAQELRDLRVEGREFDSGASCWEEVRRLFRAVDRGQPEWDVPAYNGGMFSPDPEVSPAGAILDSIELGNDYFAPALSELLLVQTEKEGLQPVDFRALGVQEFGTIYEGLLECELSVAEEDLTAGSNGKYRPVRRASDRVVVRKGDIYLHDRSGSRKATGSFYTKDFVVEHLLTHVLEPALDEHLGRLDAMKDPEQASKAFFDFRVADIAMGSGHFLVAAVNRIERRLSNYMASHPLPGVVRELRRLRAAAQKALGPGGDTLDIEDTQLLRRQIARRCIFGVDVNAMAVDLSRLSMWIHTFVPGLPLSFLDHNLVVGNSLVGIATFEEAKKAGGDGMLFGTEYLQGLLDRGKEAVERLGTLADADAGEVREARRADREVDRALRPLGSLFTILAASRVEEGIREELQLGRLMELARTPDRIHEDRLYREAEKRLGTVKPFHFATAFPEVFRPGRAGFDVIVGNPPWEEATVEEDRFWVRYKPGLQGLPQVEQERVKARLRSARPDLVARLEQEIEEAATIRNLLTAGGYPGMGTGDADLYKAFCWRFWELARKPGGKIGVVLPRSAFSALGSTEFRKTIFKQGTFLDLTFLLNSGGWVFDEAHPRYTICLTALERVTPPEDATLPTRGAYSSKEAFDLGVSAPSPRLPLRKVLSWTEDALVPLLPGPGSEVVFEQLRKAPRVDLDDGKSWMVRPHRELDATNDKKVMKFVPEKPKGFVPVFKGESFDIWVADNGPDSYYAWADPGKVVPYLLDKRRRSANRTESPFGHLDHGALIRDDSHPYFGPRIAFRDVTNRTNSRTVIAALVPAEVAIANTAPFLIWARGDEKDQAFLLGILCSIPLDWFARRFVEVHANFHIFNMLPVPRPERTDPGWKRVVALAGRLASPDRRFAKWAKAVGVEAGPLPADEIEEMVAELDAVVAHLYGLTEPQLVHIFETFHEGWDYQGRLKRVLRYFRAGGKP